MALEGTRGSFGPVRRVYSDGIAPGSDGFALRAARLAMEDGVASLAQVKLIRAHQADSAMFYLSNVFSAIGYPHMYECEIPLVAAVNPDGSELRGNTWQVCRDLASFAEPVTHIPGGIPLPFAYERNDTEDVSSECLAFARHCYREEQLDQAAQDQARKLFEEFEAVTVAADRYAHARYLLKEGAVRLRYSQTRPGFNKRVTVTPPRRQVSAEEQ